MKKLATERLLASLMIKVPRAGTFSRINETIDVPAYETFSFFLTLQSNG